MIIISVAGNVICSVHLSVCLFLYLIVCEQNYAKLESLILVYVAIEDSHW